MEKIKSLADLKKIRDNVQSKIDLREKSEHPENLIQIKVAMATCGIAAGSKETMNYFLNNLEKNGIQAVVTQTGCMGYCFAEPTVEITKPGKEPIVSVMSTVLKQKRHPEIPEKRRIGRRDYPG